MNSTVDKAVELYTRTGTGPRDREDAAAGLHPLRDPGHAVAVVELALLLAADDTPGGGGTRQESLDLAVAVANAEVVRPGDGTPAAEMAARVREAVVGRFPTAQAAAHAAFQHLGGHTATAAPRWLVEALADDETHTACDCLLGRAALIVRNTAPGLRWTDACSAGFVLHR